MTRIRPIVIELRKRISDTSSKGLIHRTIYSFKFLLIVTALALITNVTIIELGSALWQINFVVLLILVANISYKYAEFRIWRAQNRVIEEVEGNVPQDVVFHYDEDAETRTALITKQNGDVVTVEIPPEVNNPQDAVRYIMEQTMGLQLPEEQ